MAGSVRSWEAATNPLRSGSQRRGTRWANSPRENAGPLDPGTHLAAPLAGERGGPRRSENSPVWILGLFHAFSSIKSRTRHMIIKEKISVPPPQTTAVEAPSSTSGPRPHPGQVLTASPALPSLLIGREDANLGSEALFPEVIGPFGHQCEPTDLFLRSGSSKRRL